MRDSETKRIEELLAQSEEVIKRGKTVLSSSDSYDNPDKFKEFDDRLDKNLLKLRVIAQGTKGIVSE